MKLSEYYGKIIEEHKNRCANPHIGVIIKRRRIDLNLTLEEVTRGICCVSYLSKLEHGTIIPKEYVLREVLRRLNMSEDNIRTKDEYLNMILDCLCFFYYENYGQIKKYFESLASLERIHYADVIKAIYYLSIDDIQTAKDCINSALIVKNDLDDLELDACVIISALIAEKETKYGEALEIIKKIDKRYINNIEVNKLRLATKCRLNLIMGNYVNLQYDLKKLLDCCNETVDYKGMMIVKEQIGISLAYNKDEQAALEIFDNIKMSLGSVASNLYLIEVYKALKKPVELLKKCKLNDIDKLWAYNLLKNKENCIKILDNIDLENIVDEREKLFVQSLMKKYYESEFFYIAYLKEIYYPYTLQHFLYEDALTIKEKLVTYYTLESKYKEALKVIRDFEKIFY